MAASQSTVSDKGRDRVSIWGDKNVMKLNRDVDYTTLHIY